MIANCLVLIEYLFTLEPIVQVILVQASAGSSLVRLHQSLLSTLSTLVMSPCESQQYKAKRQRRTALATRRDNCGVLLLLPDKHTHACTQAPALHTHTNQRPPREPAHTHTRPQSDTAATSPAAAHSPTRADHSVDIAD